MKSIKIKNNKISNSLNRIIKEDEKRKSDKYQRHRNKSTKQK